MYNISTQLQTAINKAYQLAKVKNHEYLTPEHLLFSFLNDTTIIEMLTACGSDISPIKADVTNFLNELPNIENYSEDQEPQLTEGAKLALQIAFDQTQSSNQSEMESKHVLIAFFDIEESHAVYFLQKQGIDRLKLVRYITDQKHKTFTKNIDKENKSTKPASVLKKFCINLTEKAANNLLDPVIGREEEINRMIHILARRRKNNPLLIGETGVGKTSTVEGLAQTIQSENCPEHLKSTKIFLLQLNKLIAGTKYRGEFEDRLETIIEALATQESIILFIDDIHLMLSAGSQSGNSTDAAGILKPLFSSDKCRCIGTTSTKDFRSKIQKEPAIARQFETISLSEPTIEESIKILQGLKKYYEEFHQISYNDDAINTCVTASHHYLKDRYLPDKAIDIMDEAGAKIKLSKESTVTASHIETIIATMARVPSLTLHKSESESLQHLETHLKSKLFGQDHAITHLTNAIHLQRSGLNEKDKTIGSFLFAGPTGVGKTELAKLLAQELGVDFLRFDMSEYMEKHSVSRLIGSPPGYVGFDQDGQLTEAVNKHPHAVVLLDEIEKAHPDLITILLQVMDHATLTDSSGRDVNFSHVILIMTTNTGARESSQTPIGFKQTDYLDKSIKSIEKEFTPEFRNRLTAIIQFNPLKPKIIESIAKKCLEECKLLLREKNILLSYSEDVPSYLATKGYDKKFGARPIKRLVEQEIKQPLSNELLFGCLQNGGNVKLEIKNKLIYLLFHEKKSNLKKK
jgi:ATP-dependent Clp protease ATP-binding subunit ClpA